MVFILKRVLFNLFKSANLSFASPVKFNFCFSMSTFHLCNVSFLFHKCLHLLMKYNMREDCRSTNTGILLLQFHQTLKTYLNDRVWEFHFYVSKSWPDQPVILHFPGMTKTVRQTILFNFLLLRKISFSKYH